MKNQDIFDILVNLSIPNIGLVRVQFGGPVRTRTIHR